MTDRLLDRLTGLLKNKNWYEMPRLLAMVCVAPGAQAGLSSHSVSYEVKLAADADKSFHVEGMGTYSLTRSCKGWTLGEVYQFGIEKGEKVAPKQLGDKADQAARQADMAQRRTRFEGALKALKKLAETP